MDLRMEGMVFQTTPHLFCLHVHVGGMVLIGKVKVGYSQFRFSMNTGPSQFRLLTLTLNYVRDTEKIIFSFAAHLSRYAELQRSPETRPQL